MKRKENIYKIIDFKSDWLTLMVRNPSYLQDLEHRKNLGAAFFEALNTKKGIIYNLRLINESIDYGKTAKFEDKSNGLYMMIGKAIGSMSFRGKFTTVHREKGFEIIKEYRKRLIEKVKTLEVFKSSESPDAETKKREIDGVTITRNDVAYDLITDAKIEDIIPIFEDRHLPTTMKSTPYYITGKDGNQVMTGIKITTGKMYTCTIYDKTAEMKDEKDASKLIAARELYQSRGFDFSDNDLRIVRVELKIHGSQGNAFASNELKSNPDISETDFVKLSFAKFYKSVKVRLKKGRTEKWKNPVCPRWETLFNKMPSAQIDYTFEPPEINNHDFLIGEIEKYLKIAAGKAVAINLPKYDLLEMTKEAFKIKTLMEEDEIKNQSAVRASLSASGGEAKRRKA